MCTKKTDVLKPFRERGMSLAQNAVINQTYDKIERNSMVYKKGGQQNAARHGYR